jgi:hypothetical protein
MMNFKRLFWLLFTAVTVSFLLSACAVPEKTVPTPVVFVDEDAAKAPSSQAQSMDPTEEPAEEAEITGGDASRSPRLTQDDLCLSGPGQEWVIQSSLTQGTEVQLIGVGQQPGWLVLAHPQYPEIHCWVPEEHVDLPNPEILTELPILPIPQKP